MLADPLHTYAFDVLAPPNGVLSHFQVTWAAPFLQVRIPDQERNPEQYEVSVLLMTRPQEPIVADALKPVATYQSLPGNLPQDYKNWVALWNSTQPNPAGEPLARAPVSDNSQTGVLVLPYDLQKTDYCLTYQCGETAKTMCAIATIPLGSSKPAMESWVTLTIKSLTSAGITIEYSALPNYNPNANGNWIGIWPGSGLPYPPSPDPIARYDILSPYSDEIVTIPFKPKVSQYILVYFTGAAHTSIASAIWFLIRDT